MKKEKFDYFEEFIKNANYTLEIIEILKNHFENFDYSKATEIENKIHIIENKADESHHNLLNYLIKDFLPPIDREDIVSLSHKIDNIVDSIDELAINLNILDVEVLREDVIEFSKLLSDSCIAIKNMLEKFKNIKNYDEIHNLVISINVLEEKGDKLYQNAIRNLYHTETNPILINKWSIIYNCFENCFDSCENVADDVDEIILKNS